MILTAQHPRILSRCLGALTAVLAYLWCAPLLSAQDLLESGTSVQIQSGNLFFPQSVGNEQLQAVVYQEIEYSTANSGLLYLSFAVNQQGIWQRYSRVSDAVAFTRAEPPLLFSALVTADGTLVMALLSDTNTITVYEYTAADNQVRAVAEIRTEATTVAPRLFQRQNGDIICFVNSRDEQSDQQGIYFTVSRNRRDWSTVRVVAPFANNRASFLPTYAFIDNREFIVFQSLAIGQASSYQLYVSYSDNGGGRWSQPKLITQFRVPGEEGSAPEYENQYPTIVADQERILLAWERRARTERGRIIYTELNRQGTVTASPISITTIDQSGSRPQVLINQGRKLIGWSGGQGSGRFIAVSGQNQNGVWIAERVSRGVPAIFSSLVEYDRNSVRVSWGEPTAAGSRIYSRIVTLNTPQFIVSGENFDATQSSSNRIAVITWRQSGGGQSLSGFRYSWSFGEQAAPVGDVQLPGEQDSIRLIADQEGVWYFSLQPQDAFGNWLEPIELQYRYDTTPPQAVRITEPALDDTGFVATNTFDITWMAENAADIAGYYVDFRRIGTITQSAEQINGGRPERIQVNYRTSSIRNLNIDNGLWRLQVAAVDRAGNSGPLTERLYRLNKYVPTTLIYGVSSRTSERGIATLAVSGRGFLEEGRIVECIVDADGAEPYDYRFPVAADGCAIINDGTIERIPLARIRGGNYFIGLNHSRRGITLSRSTFELLPSGRVLFGEFETPYQPRIAAATMLFANRDNVRIGIGVLALLLLLLAIFLASRVLVTIRESRAWKKELQLLDYGGDNNYTEAERMATLGALRLKGISLRIKFIIFITLLVITVVFLISIILGSASLRRQERVLATSLQDRVAVLLDSISTQAGTIFLESQNTILDLEPLVNQLTVLTEARYITITGAVRDDPQSYGAVWATNDARVLNFGLPSADDQEGDAELLTTTQFIAGASQLNDAVADTISGDIVTVNEQAGSVVGSAPQQIIDVNQQIVRLITESLTANRTPDPDALETLDNQLRMLTIELNANLRSLQSNVNSFPQYDAEQLDRNQTRYLFYQPIIAWSAERTATSGQFYQGTVRIGVDTGALLTQLDAAQNEIVLTTLLIAIIASVFGILGASLLATIVVAPIHKVVRGVEVISDTEDKSELREHVITVRSRDELSILAQSVNQMTRGLVKASDANKELIIGKEIQKLFIPLTKDAAGNKLSVAADEYDHIEIGGYYEGAHGVSGDYFSYAQLDQEHFAIIKCDVSGKGVPAALIMVGVATIFSDFVRTGRSYQEPHALSNLAKRMNDLLESMQFRGRFAALTMAIINQKSGQVRITNAGDKQIHVYRAAVRRVEVINLPETPAAGVFPSDMLPNGFVERTFTLNKNDCLLFFTDGIDESRRMIRNPDFSVSQTTENGRKTEAAEEFGVERIHDITVSVMNQASYHLKRERDIVSEAITFDYRGIPPTAISLIKAIVTVEHLFRLYPASVVAGYDANARDRHAAVRIDREIVQFLQKTFSGMGTFFGHEVTQSAESQYSAYHNLYEDEQYDDLTIVAIRKK